MSFILDALKKSESERARQAGPALMEVRIAPPRNRLPLWALLVGALLLLNIVVLGSLLIYRRNATPPLAVAAATTAVATPAAVAPPVVATLPPTPAVAPALPILPPEPVLEANTAPLNPADYVPALPAGSSALPVREPAEENLPSRDDLIAAGQQVPELRLSLHVFDPVPANRYVLVNSSRLREGDSMPDGMRLERITEGGVVLSWRGTRFNLRRGD